MFVDRRPLTTGTTASTPQFWARAFAGTRRLSRRTKWRLDHGPEMELIARFVPKGGSILDAGSGDGTWVAYLRERGYSVAGVDYSEDLIEAATRRYPGARWVRADIRSTPFLSQTFDAIVSWGVIEHEPEGPRAALKEFWRILKPGGQIIVTVPQDHPMQRHFVETQRKYYYGKELGFFQFFYTPPELANEVSNAGFRVIECSFLKHPSAEFVWPTFYAKYGHRRNVVRLLWLVSLLRPMRATNTMMIYSVAEKHP